MGLGYTIWSVSDHLASPSPTAIAGYTISRLLASQL